MTVVLLDVERNQLSEAGHSVHRMRTANYMVLGACRGGGSSVVPTGGL
jgi:hypothetical protein